MINEDYVNKEAKTNHYAYIYYKDDIPVCYASNGKIEFFDDDDYYSNLTDVSEIIDYIEDDCGNGEHNSRKFRKLYLYYDRGKHDCTFVNAHSLKWCPKVITGDFNCSNNRIHSLKYGPEKIDGNFICSHNKLTSLEGGPKEIDGTFTCYDNKISKEELLRYLKTAKISGGVHTDHGDFNTQQQAIKELSGGQIKESYFGY